MDSKRLKAELRRVTEARHSKKGHGPRPAGNGVANTERRKVHDDLLSLGERCAPNTVAKLMHGA